MARLLYTAICSLDGYVADEAGDFSWAAPDEEVHAYVNDLERPVGMHLYGRRMYETMAVWETLDVSAEPAVMRDYAEIWRAAEKVVYSTTLAAVTTARTRHERTFEAAAIRAMKAASPSDISISGPTLAAAALRAGLVDRLDLFLVPVVVGGGTPALPAGLRLALAPAGDHRFASGVIHLRYDIVTPPDTGSDPVSTRDTRS
jgi:dihydrofolate reductase